MSEDIEEILGIAASEGDLKGDADRPAASGASSPAPAGYGKRYAIWSLTLGLVGIPFLFGAVGMVAGLFAIVMGMFALREMSRHSNVDGKPLAVVGIILGIIELGIVTRGILLYL